MGTLERFFFVISCGLMLLLLFLIFFSEKGVRDWLVLNSEHHRILSENDNVRKENRELARKIERLKKDLGYIEHIARHELEMAAGDELVFRFRNSESSGEGKK